MTEQLDPETALLVGIAHLLDTAGAATYQADELYADDVNLPVTLDLLPPGRPAVALRITNDAPIDHSSTRYSVQALLRVRPGDRSRVAAIRDALDGQRQPVMPAGIRCTSIRLNTRVPLGLRGSWDEHSLNFVALCARASAWAGGATY